MRQVVPMDKERPQRDDFSQAEAEAKVGQHVRSLVAFAGQLAAIVKALAGGIG